MKKQVVIVHNKMGIFVGGAFGLAFWSMMDTGGQFNCVTFEDEDDARDYVSGWSPKQDPDEYRYVEVDTMSEWASVEELHKAGLGDFTALLLYNTPSAGQA